MASARPPSVMMLIVWPMALRQMIDARIESGIEIEMMSVLRHEPRSTRMSSAVRAAAMIASRTTPSIEARTKSDWSPSSLTFSSGGRPGRARASASLTRLMMSSVEAFPDFCTVIIAERWPFTRTMFVWGG